ncbi:monodechloroaminopyrrolnitrin synthase PrnB family protein [uncultured Ferrimonas sp.]|uniref:PrnB family protein n=1 Tax=uncultured Ferrimonas sp. TaxID=432640 RepID=UPI00262B5512|nr:monodechloroaminopyrrolnitrin synthase PrnB family protein [uncultured Ferrimonas sp.]
MNNKVAAFDGWIRSDFIAINSELEQRYFDQADPANVVGVGDDLKQQLQAVGREHCIELLAQGNTDEGFDQAFDLLGNVGLYLAACRRHGLSDPDNDRTSPQPEASALALHIAASIGVVPRFATAHLCTHNRAINGHYKRFTDLSAEQCFIDYNSKGILAFKRASEALMKVLPLGISHPIALDLFKAAEQALLEVHHSNQQLFAQLDPDQFFYGVRPYYKPHHVGSQVYRGANAGDFAGINVIDMLLGLCQANEPAYGRMLVEKFLYMMPQDQQILRECMRQRSLLDQFLDVAATQHRSSWYQQHLTAFLRLCELHGDIANQHHEQLVDKYIVKQAQAMDQKHMGQLTASGPQLAGLMKSLTDLRDRRAGLQRHDIVTSYTALQQLRASLNT